MMRFAEIIETITPIGPLSPSAYAPVAQQRDAAHKEKVKGTQLARQQQQQLNQQQLQAKRRTAKPKPIKWLSNKKSMKRHRTK